MTEIQGLEDLTFVSSTKYTILEEIGRGGMGVVYLAERSALGVSDRVVLKTIRNLDPRDEDDLRREANLATGLRHDNIVRTFGLEALPLDDLPPEVRGALDGPPRRAVGFRRRRREAARRPIELRGDRTARSPGRRLLLMVMDHVEGIDLRRLHRSHFRAGYRIPTPLVAFVVAQIARALAYAHKRIVHRDISPDNILVNVHGVPKLSDFGVAAAAGAVGAAGKTIYMSPEALSGRPVDGRSDVFGLGLTAFHLLTGVSPIGLDRQASIDDQLESARRQVEAGLPAPIEVDRRVPPSLSQIIGRMMATDPADRYPRAAAAADDLEQNYLYAEGYGPTSGSLGAYIRFFESGFQETDNDDIAQLTFLRDARGRMEVRQAIDPDDLTNLGRRMVKARPEEAMFGAVVQIEKARRRDRKPTDRILRFVVGDGLVESIALGEGPLTVGRDPDNDLVLDLPGVARHHLRIGPVGDRDVLEALDAEAVTRAAGRAVVRIELPEGVRLRVGRVRGYYLVERVLPEPDRIVEVGEDDLDLEDLLDRSVAFRFTPDPETVGLVRSALADLLGPVAMDESARADLEEGIGRTIEFLSDPLGQRMEVRTFPVKGRVVFQIRGLDDASTIEPAFALLRRAALHREDASSPIRGIDRIEYRHHEGALRLTTSLG